MVQELAMHKVREGKRRRPGITLAAIRRAVRPLERIVVNPSRPTQKLHSLGQSLWLDNITARTVAAAMGLHGRAARPNLCIKIAGTPEGLPAPGESIFRGVPINVTLLFRHGEKSAALEKVA
jgi:transaldolase